MKLAYRNMFRYKRRTLITFSTVALGLTFLIFGISLVNGIDKHGSDNMINSQTAHLTVFSKGYHEKKDDLPLDLTIKQPQRIRELLTGLPAVKAAEQRIMFAAGIIKGMDELPIRGVGIEPGKDPELFDIKESLVEGAWLEPGETRLLIGKNLARDMRLSVGDPVTLRMITSSKDEEMSWNAMDLEIKGIFDTPNPIVNSQWIFLPLDLVREGLSLKDEVTEIVIRLKSTNSSDKDILAAQQQISALLASTADPAHNRLEVITWQELSGIFLTLNKLKSKRVAMFILIMLIVASLGIINTMLMAVFERTREIGMLSAMGMKKSEIKKLFIFEGGFIGGFGSLIGCILGGLLGWYLEVKGIWLFPRSESVQRALASIFPVKGAFYGDLTIDLLVTAFILGTVISIIASLYPAAKAAKLDPIAALRYI
jgi:putative ABC transport system permease protein